MSSKKEKILNFPNGLPAQFRMIDVGRKRTTRRRAIACGTIIVGAIALKKILEKSLPKGDVLALAEIAGIIGAKKTPDLIPMCHTLPLDQVTIHCLPQEPDSIMVYCQVTAHAKTGVEMEAITGAQAALATIWDLVKGTEPALRITDVTLLVKEGGKSGLWINPEGIPAWLEEQLPSAISLNDIKVALIIMSDRAATGAYEDRSGPILRDVLEDAGAVISDFKIIPDERETLIHHIGALSGKAEIIFISGGTGLGPRDITPETLNQVCDRIIPGFGELLRQDGAQLIDTSWLSRSMAGMIGNTLVVALPGSPKAVREGLEALLPLLPHALAVINGGKHG